MPEFRQNMATKEWIIIAAERAKRPEEFARTRPHAEELPLWDEKCPFCPENEGKTPPALLTLPAGAAPGKWQVRVIPNKFPALVSREGETCQRCSSHIGPYLRREGVGHHEVVIETPFHNRDLPLLAPAHMEEVMRAYRDRYAALIPYDSTELIVIFRNHGANAGTSLIHPHSQIVASSVVPFHVRNRIYEGQRYFDNTGGCVYCEMIAYERSAGVRVVFENERFIAISPYAASVPYEIWLLPKHHRATFGQVADDELRDLAHVLQNLLTRLWRLLDDPDYNYVIDSAPDHLAEVPFYHWHLEIYPKLTTQAGFEIGSGIGINIQPPEEAAARLRDVSDAPMTVEEANGHNSGE